MNNEIYNFNQDLESNYEMLSDFSPNALDYITNLCQRSENISTELTHEINSVQYH